MEPIELEEITDDIYRGPFYEVQRAAGATFYEDYGHLWTKGFGDPEAEYWAVRNGVGLWDVSALVKIHITGADVLPALDRLTTRAMLEAAPGTVRYGMVLDEAGIMLDEGTACVISATEAYFFGNDESAEFLAHLEAHTNDLDVRFDNVTSRMGTASVQGPGSLELLATLTDADISGLRWFRLLPEPIEIAGVRGILVRAGFTGEKGYEFYLLDGHEGGTQLWNAIVAAGAVPIGLDAIQMLRIEAGLVIGDEDYWPGQTDPYDLSLDRFIDLEDHAFIGRAVCVDTAVAPPRRFVTLSFDTPEGEAPSAPVAGAVVHGEAREVGEVTSAVVTPRFGALALAVLETAFSKDGTLVSVDGRAATVRPLPIDDPAKVRPRA